MKGAGLAVTQSVHSLPELPGYISVARAAKMLGCSKPTIYSKIYDQQVFKHAYRLGGAEDETGRPVLVLLEQEVKDLLTQQQQQVAVVPLRHRLNAWNRRVKEWGRQGNWSGVIHTAGQPHLELANAYEAAHPDDLRPRG